MGKHVPLLHGKSKNHQLHSQQKIDIIRIAGGKLVERWGEMDMLGMLQQLGVVPLPGQVSS